MKKFIAGFVSAIVVVGFVFLAAKELAPLGYEMEIRKVKDRTVPTFDVFKDGEYLFQYSVVGNGFYLRVEEDELLSPRMFFSKLDQYSDGMHYSLMSSRLLEDGSLHSVYYDMDSGEVESTLIYNGNGMKAYDSEGKLIEPDNGLGEVNGVTRHSLETLNQRREELAVKLRNYEPPVDEQN